MTCAPESSASRIEGARAAGPVDQYALPAAIAGASLQSNCRADQAGERSAPRFVNGLCEHEMVTSRQWQAASRWSVRNNGSEALSRLIWRSSKPPYGTESSPSGLGILTRSVRSRLYRCYTDPQCLAKIGRSWTIEVKRAPNAPSRVTLLDESGSSGVYELPSTSGSVSLTLRGGRKYLAG